MKEELLIAILNFTAKVGLKAAIAFFTSKSATIDEAVAALRIAEAVSLEDIIAEEATKRLKALEKPTPNGA